MIDRNMSPTSMGRLALKTHIKDGFNSFSVLGSRHLVLNVYVDLWNQYRPPTSFEVDGIPIVRLVILS